MIYALISIGFLALTVILLFAQQRHFNKQYTKGIETTAEAMKVAYSFPPTVLDDIDKTLKMLLSVNTSIEEVAKRMRLTIDTHSLVVKQAVDSFNRSSVTPLSFDISADMATALEKMTPGTLEVVEEKPIAEFVYVLEYSRDKFTKSPFEKRSLNSVINRVKTEYGLAT